jgi:two-component system sensor histidine kinase RegB
MNKSISQITNHKNLWQLILLRYVAIIFQTLTIFFTHFLLKISLPLTEMFLVLGGLVILNFFSIGRFKNSKNISDKSLFFELFFDVSAFAMQLYFSGGASNPFISLFLLQVIIAAVLLQGNFAWLIATITTIYYILLSFYYQHLHAFHQHGEMNSFFNLHLQGMLISYILAAVLLLVFIGKIIENLRLRDLEIHKMKEQNQMVRNAMIATSAAHELSTPLATISVILGDWKEMNLEKELIKDVEKMEKQLVRCENIISQILENSGRKRVKNS